eukprot:TRINITY_DN1114_c0_g1_i2.p1 TRINITY_DN1114_c0_g1~~TRINITY_DN1114_c0_g1_i2.p1  ORF type:complete len:318 (-),score=44.19 TRINITY_DN1114_c0_g1_i2:269-1183(-)
MVKIYLMNKIQLQDREFIVGYIINKFEWLSEFDRVNADQQKEQDKPPIIRIESIHVQVNPFRKQTNVDKTSSQNYENQVLQDEDVINGNILQQIQENQPLEEFQSSPNKLISRDTISSQRDFQSQGQGQRGRQSNKFSRLDQGQGFRQGFDSAGFTTPVTVPQRLQFESPNSGLRPRATRMSSFFSPALNSDFKPKNRQSSVFSTSSFLYPDQDAQYTSQGSQYTTDSDSELPDNFDQINFMLANIENNQKISKSTKISCQLEDCSKNISKAGGYNIGIWERKCKKEIENGLKISRKFDDKSIQ